MIKFLFGIALIITGLVLTLVNDPVWGLYLFALLTHVTASQLGESVSLPNNISLYTACFTLLFYLISSKYKQKFTRWPVETWLLGVMVVGMAIGASQAEFATAASWQFTYTYLKYLIFFVLLINLVDSYQKLEHFYYILIASAVWLVFRCWDLRGTTGARFENRGGDVISDGNHFAAALILLFPFVFRKTMSKSPIVAIGATIMCCGIVIAIFITGSRGGLLGLIALGVLIPFSYKANRKKIISVIVIFVVVSMLFMNDYHKSRFQSLFMASTSSEERDMSAQGRINAWKLAWQLYLEKPYFGVGMENFGYYSAYRYSGREYGESGLVTHSLWFEVLSQGGTVVTLPFVLLLFLFFRKTKKIIKKLKDIGKTEIALDVIAVRISLAAFLCCATFLNRLIYDPIYWCIGMGVIHGYLLVNISKDASQEIPNTENALVEIK